MAKNGRPFTDKYIQSILRILGEVSVVIGISDES